MMSTRLGAGRTVVLSVVAALAASTAGVSAAQADDPTPAPSPSSSASTPAGDPTPSPSDSTSPTPTPTATPTPTPAPTPPSTTTQVPSNPSAKACGLCLRGTYVPPEGVIFNYPYGKKKAKYTIRKHVLRTIKSVPAGGSIRLAIYSLNDWETAKALYKASQVGVTVQIVVNSHNVHGTKYHASSPPFIWLMKKLHKKIQRPGIPDDQVSFAKFCHKSCRGTGGNVHYKMFLFSSAGGADGQAAKDITMMGSPNLTYLAAQGQWNHLTTLSNDPARFADYTQMFNEMKLDVPQNPAYREYFDINPPTFFFPRQGSDATTDPLNVQLQNIRCTGVEPGYGDGTGHTVVRIGQYAWYSKRGVWLAKTVRGLWNAGCDVAIEYAIMTKPSKKILYSPSGRGRIPMRQVATFGAEGRVVTYDHAKYTAVNGAYGSSNGTAVTFAGTTNFSALGFYSDDSTQFLLGTGFYNAFLADFNRVWKGPKSHVPSSVSATPAGGQGAERDQTFPFGQGKYSKMEAD